MDSYLISRVGGPYPWALYCAIYRWISEEDTCFELWLGGKVAVSISYEELAERTDMSRVSVARWIKVLESNGFIRAIKVQGAANFFTLVMEEAREVLQSFGYHPPPSPTPELENEPL